MSLNSFRVGFARVAGGPLGKALIVLIGAILVFSFVYSSIPGNAQRPGTSTQGDVTVATVNGDPITRTDFTQASDGLSQQAQMFGQSLGPLQSAQLHDAALQRLITAKLALQAAKNLKLTASDDDIARQRQQIAQQSGFAEHLGLPATAGVADIDAALEKSGAPSLETRFPDEVMRDQVLLDKLQTYLNNQVTVSEQDARNSYQQYHTRHILIGNKTRSDVQAQAQAQQILAKAQAPGADFAALARQYSEDPGTKAKGGDDGWIDQSTSYVPEFKTAAFALKPGGVTLVKSPTYGYFIIKLDEVRSNLPKDFDKNKAQYITQVKQQKQQQAQQNFQTALNSNPANKVVIVDPELRADKESSDAAKESDPAKRQALYQIALADYQKALKTATQTSEKGDVEAQIGQIEQSALNQPDDAIAAYEEAVNDTGDANVRMALGQLYMKRNQPDKAVAQFQAAGDQAWDDTALHTQLITLYKQLKRPDLVAKETAWLAQQQARQKAQAQASMPMPGSPAAGGPPPAAAGAPPASGGAAPVVAPAGSIKVTPAAAGAPAPAGPKPPQ